MFDHARNKTYEWIVNSLAKWLPTKEYSMFLRGAIEYGMRAAARDEIEGIDPPQMLWKAK